MKTSYVLLFNNSEGKVSRLTVTKGDPSLPQADVVAILESVAANGALTDRLGVVTGPHGYDKINETRKSFDVV